MTMWAWHCVSSLTAPCAPRSWAETGEYFGLLAAAFIVIVSGWIGLSWALDWLGEWL